LSPSIDRPGHKAPDISREFEAPEQGYASAPEPLFKGGVAGTIALYAMSVGILEEKDMVTMVGNESRIEDLVTKDEERRRPWLEATARSS
jgi:hypothetical protein